MVDYESRVIEVAGELALLPVEQRSDRLEQLCGDDIVLRRRVQDLLSQLSEPAHDPSTIKHEHTRDEAPASAAPTTPLGLPAQIGRYRIIHLIGEGGMGQVFEAEQEHPRRRVALKIIRPFHITASMLRRFEFEAEVLGRLEHPGIARVYEAGTATTAHGPQPYFAMELVRGQRLDAWVASEKPTLRARLQLLIEICEAVQHAHRQGVIHRDLKPSNVLVTEQGKPRILDFGVARAIEGAEQTSPTSTFNTESGQIVGTLQYMSPEQAAGRARDLDTRSDVYALGVLAYQLLSDRLPYNVSDKPLPDALRMICEQQPDPLGTHSRELRGDLETIVFKALAKEKEQRYGSSAELSADVRRYLEYEPIAARRPSAWYQFRKFARRNKVVVGAGCFAVVALLLGTALATIGMVQARQQRSEALKQKSEADLQRAQSEAVYLFFADDVLSGAGPDRLPDKAVRDAIVKAMIEPAARTVGERFKDRPLVEAAVRSCLSMAFQSVGRGDLGLPQAQRALEIQRRVLDSDHPTTLNTIGRVGYLLADQGKLTEAEPLLRELVERSRRVLGNNHRDTLVHVVYLGSLLHTQGKFDEAEPLLREAVQSSRRVFGDDNPATLNALSNLASLLGSEGKSAEAESLSREVLEKGRRVFGNDHPSTMAYISSLAIVLAGQGKWAEAEPLFREDLERSRRVMGNDHPYTLASIDAVARVLEQQERFAEAEPLYRESMAGSRRVLGDDHPDTLISLKNMGIVLANQRKFDEAEVLLLEAVQRSRRVLGNEHSNTLSTIRALSAVQEEQGKLAEAETLLRELLKGFRNTEGDAKADTLDAMDRLVGVLQAQGKFAEAEPLAAELYRQTPASEFGPAEAARFMSWKGICLTKLGRYSEAEAPLWEAYSRLQSAGPKANPQIRAVVTALAETCESTGRAEEARKWRSELESLDGTTRSSTQPAR